jgi:RNA polymerase sigma factor (TIGR02999 family)
MTRPESGDGSGTPEQRRDLDELFNAAYEELRRLASRIRRDERSATLSPTALVNEAWIKLANSPRFASSSQLHFKRIAARAMRQVLVEAARRRNARKRGGGKEEAVGFVAFDDSIDAPRPDERAVIALDAALDDLARIHPRQALMIESRFFGGLDITETAA